MQSYSFERKTGKIGIIIKEDDTSKLMQINDSYKNNNNNYKIFSFFLYIIKIIVSY